jgi:hypothetical protein
MNLKMPKNIFLELIRGFKLALDINRLARNKSHDSSYSSDRLHNYWFGCWCNLVQAKENGTLEILMDFFINLQINFFDFYLSCYIYHKTLYIYYKTPY